jgi:nitroreductase
MDESLRYALELIRRRRSWKPALMDREREVPRALVEHLLTAAIWAPTHGLTQPWRFRVFTGEARTRLAEALPLVYDVVTPPHQVRPEKREKLGLAPRLAPVVVALGVVIDPMGKIPAAEEIAALGGAVQNMHLAATAAQLAACWSSPPLCSTPEGAAALGFAPGTLGMGLFYIGWPAPGASLPEMAAQRLPLGERVEWV